MLKRCQKPAMTGNGMPPIYISVVIWGMVYGIGLQCFTVLPTLLSVEVTALRETPNISMSRLVQWVTAAADPAVTAGCKKQQSATTLCDK